MANSIATLCIYLATLSPLGCGIAVYTFTFVLMVAVSGMGFRAEGFSCEVDESDFFGGDLPAVDHRDAILPLALPAIEAEPELITILPWKSRKAPPSPVWALDCGDDWGTFYVQADQFEQAEAAFLAACRDVGLAPPECPILWDIWIVGQAPKDAAVIVA